jgi:glycosyltransferase involved in cell wall biosynthesis
VRVAFTLIGGSGWTGGRNYLRNLLASLARVGPPRLTSLLFTGADVDAAESEELAAFLAAPPVRLPVFNRGRAGASRLARGILLQRDRAAEAAFRAEGVDLVFQHSAWLGARFGLPTIAWIADFQHRRLPGMFSPGNWLRREAGYWGLSVASTTILLSSRDARACCERYYPLSRGKTAVLPFAVAPPPESWEGDVAACRARYGLPERYLYLPNQFWKHKNHMAAILALRQLEKRCPDLILVLSGALLDPRHRAHPELVLASIDRLGVASRARVLGVIPYDDVLTLARGAVAVLNPSLSEGWSTTVEEAKTFQTPLCLSDLPVHREQAPEGTVFFDPRSPRDLADALERAWAAKSPARPSLERVRRDAAERQERFAEGFHQIARETMARFQEGWRRTVGVPAKEVGGG